MRILLCLNRDFIANLALNYLLPALDGHVFDMVLSERIGKKDAPVATALKEWGTLESGLFSLVEQGNAPPGPFQSFAQIAQRSESKTIRHFASLNAGEGHDYLRRFQPDVIVSIRFGQIFKSEAIGVPPLGIINLHGAILPNYRGILGILRAMQNRDKDVGCTLHYVSDGTIDTGAIIGIHTLPTQWDRSLLWNLASLYHGGVRMIIAALEKFQHGETVEARTADADGCYFSFPLDEEVNRFLAGGGQLYAKEDYQQLFLNYGIRNLPWPEA